MEGFKTLLYKECLRFWKVGFQTVLSPVLTAVLYLLIFGHVLEDHVQPYPGVNYTAFLVPGLVMMTVLQNAFANSSSSLIQSKITGNIVFVLLPPISYREFYSAYVIAAMLRELQPERMVRLALDRRLHAAGRGLPGQPGCDCRHLGRQVRSAGGLPELPDHAAHHAVRRVLLDSLPAGFLAGSVAFQPVFLHD